MHYEHYEYRLKKEENKKSINLQEHKENIKYAVNKIFKDNVESVLVHENYFEFDLKNKAQDSDLRKMGKEIVENDKELNALKADYGYSTQLFIRKH